MLTKEEISTYFQNLQHNICNEIETADAKGVFISDTWKREEGGGGISKVIENGAIIEKGGVMFSAVFGQLHEKMLVSMGINENTSFFATGVSIVMHPKNPHVPIIHMNIRYFEMENGQSWFGGGIDLTPHYVVDEDAIWFHKYLKNSCDNHGNDYYQKFKEWADNYFYNTHRNETRGVGGIFFDYQKPDETKTKQQIFDFVKQIGESFVPIYTFFMHKNCSYPVSIEEKNWQKLRRGRYVEFNLVYDRGTKFGLETNGRTESILMSMPPEANWAYNFIPIEGSKEEKTQSKLKKGINWVE